MPLIKSISTGIPSIHPSCYLAENATIIGDVRIAKDCSIWFNAVIRADVNSITIGSGSNVQDAAILHCTYKRAALNIGKNVSIGHGAILHGCTIEDNVLIGMKAIVMDECIIPSNCLIAAGAIVTEGKVLESGYVYAGIPARPIKKLDDRLSKGEIQRIAKNYHKYSSWYQ